MIAAMTLARLCVGLGFVALVRRQGSAHIGGLLELPLLVAAHVPFVCSRVDKFAFGDNAFLC